MAKDKAVIQAEREKHYQKLIELGIALSVERNSDRLMERILEEAKSICHADGGTLYLATEDQCLKFAIMLNDSLNIAQGGTSGKEISIPPLPLYDAQTGKPNHHNVATHAALTGETINIPDAYVAEGFDFLGTKKFDKGTGYRSKSFLTVPMKDNEGMIIGVLQLINAQDPETGEVIPVSAEIQPMIEALASQAAVALDNQLLLEDQRKLLESFIELIAGAIDAKSPYTGGHCQRVPVLTKMLADKACESDDPRFCDFNLTEEERYELHIAAWLHDCGKVTTPEFVVDKATKLETIYDRINEIRMRFEVLKRDAEITYLKALNTKKSNAKKLREKYNARIAQLDEDFAFVGECNIGGEYLDPDKVERLKKIGKQTWMRTLDDRIGAGPDELKRKLCSSEQKLPVKEFLLADKEEHLIFPKKTNTLEIFEKFGFKMDIPKYKYNNGELYNLSVARGTLSEEERFKINDHIVQTIMMLEQLPFPRHLRRVPEFAGGHHEKMDGTGYPRRLEREQMSLPARMMAIADIFEALTAADRPYKKAKTLSESIRIMSFMKKDKHIDPDLFELFLTSGIYRQYAEEYLLPEQLDEVDITQYIEKK